MEQYTGKSVFQKIAAGPVYYYEKQKNQVKREHVDDVKEEISCFEAARVVAKGQLDRLYQKALKEVGEDEAAVFETHQMLLDDDDFIEAVRNEIVEQKVNASYAVAAAGDRFAALFSGMQDAYMQARAADIRDISERLVAVISGQQTGTGNIAEPVILIAEDLAPSETVQLDKTKILAFVTKKGSANSHTAILARAMNIPALIGVDIQKSWNGRDAVVDGFAGTITIDPDPVCLSEARERIEEEKRREMLLKELKGRPTQTKSGRSIHLYANIANVTDLAAVLENDAEGIGLFRSEFLYLEANDYPTEEAQFRAYKSAARTMGGRKVIIRTLDIGADKKADYFHLQKEDNPAMGYRAIRICLTRPEIFKTQLRAILRASAYGNIAIMFPMIISVSEVQRAKEILNEVKTELRQEGLAYKDVETGIMIETPAAVMISDQLAKEVDFFSIGTNDLTQYMLAVDRQNPKLDEFYDPHHPAVLGAIRTVVENAHKNGIWVGICGELAADITLTETFVRMGVDELSVSSSFVLPVREAVRQLE